MPLRRYVSNTVCWLGLVLPWGGITIERLGAIVHVEMNRSKEI
jgi:hypothetical protein